MKAVCLCLHYALSADICTQWWDPPWTFLTSRLDSPSSLRLLVSEMHKTLSSLEPFMGVTLIYPFLFWRAHIHVIFICFIYFLSLCIEMWKYVFSNVQTLLIICEHTRNTMENSNIQNIYLTSAKIKLNTISEVHIDQVHVLDKITKLLRQYYKNAI